MIIQVEDTYTQPNKNLHCWKYKTFAAELVSHAPGKIDERRFVKLRKRVGVWLIYIRRDDCNE